MDLRRVDVRDFLSQLGIRNMDDQGEEIQFSCPFGGHRFGDDTPSAYMNTETTAFFCHGCKAKGNAIHFLAKLEGISPLLAARHIQDRYDVDFLEPGSSLAGELDELFSTTQPVVAPVQEVVYEMDPLPDEALDYLHTRGFGDSILEEWKIGYDKLSDRIAIPVRDENGMLVGFKGRAYHSDHKPKYLVLGDRPKRKARYGFPTYDVSRIVFGLDKIPEGTHQLILTEGELDVIALCQSGYQNCVSVGSLVSTDQRRLVISRATSVVCFLDDDPAGRAASEKIAKEFLPYVQVKTVGPHEGDPASLTSEECATLIDEAQTIDPVGLTQFEE